jgi:hypothetical protein
MFYTNTSVTRPDDEKFRRVARLHVRSERG